MVVFKYLKGCNIEDSVQSCSNFFLKRGQGPIELKERKADSSQEEFPNLKSSQEWGLLLGS